MKQRTHQVWLVFPSPLADRPDKGRADCVCRLTPARIIVESGIVTEGRGLSLGGLPFTFDRKTGRSIPRRRRGWTLQKGERERLNKLEST